jgi:hypothetical protein
MNNFNNVGVAAVGCVGFLAYVHYSGIFPVVYAAVGAIALLGYMAFASGTSINKRRAPTSDKYLGPDDPVTPYR